MAATAPAFLREPSIPTLGFTDQQQPSCTSNNPHGACNFRELTLGHTCGCKRFCSNLYSPPVDPATGRSIAGAEVLWCYCGHHACFHAKEEEVDIVPFAQIPRSIHHQATSSLRPLSFPSDLREYNAPTSIAQAGGPASSPAHDPQDNTARPEQNPNGFQPRQMSLSQHVPFSTQTSFRLPSDSGSRATRAPRPSPNRLFMTQLAAARQRLDTGHPSAELVREQADGIRSPTELATTNNSIVGSPSLLAADAALQAVNTGLDQLNEHLMGQADALAASQTRPPTKDGSNSLDASSPEQLPLTERLLAQISSLRAVLLTVPNLSTTVSALARRIDVVENSSFGHVSIEDLQDRYEQVDARMLEMDARLVELERLCEGALVNGSDRGHVVGNQPTGSDGIVPPQAFGSNNPADHGTPGRSPSPPNNIEFETTARLDYLERRLLRFESTALPSSTNPWDIEVVLLPWSRHLKGLWSSLLDFSQMSVPSSAESQALVPERELSPSWRPPSSDDWLFARACGPTSGIYGKIYDRLKSRGFVQNVTITNSSARAVEIEVMWSMVAQLQVLDDDVNATAGYTRPPPELLALANPWIPLLKVHKSSRLRFLTTAELATPSLWTAEFLNSSAFMKAPVAGKRRLYITHPAAYMQRPTSPADWTWQRLRNLPRVRQAHDVLGSLDTSNALEGCWEHDPRLDEPKYTNSSMAGSSSSGSSFNSSFASPPPSPKQPSHSMNMSQPAFCEHVVEQSHNNSQHESRPLLGSHVSQPITLQRTVSNPIAAINDISMASPSAKRPHASFDEANLSAALPSSAAHKRRRLSKTPSGDGVPASAWGFTPRLSREPPSPASRFQYQFQHQERPSSRRSNPGTNVAIAGPAPSVTQRRGRGITPTAYATPFSNSVNGAGEVYEIDLGYMVYGDTDVDCFSADDSDDDNDSGADGDDEGQPRTETALYWRGTSAERDALLVPEISGPSANEDDVWNGVDEEDVHDTALSHDVEHTGVD